MYLNDKTIADTRCLQKVISTTSNNAQAWRSGACPNELEDILVLNFPTNLKQ